MQRDSSSRVVVGSDSVVAVARLGSMGAMGFVTVRRSTDQTTIVNVDQITYLSHDIYGTKIFFVSGDHIVCPEDIDELSQKLFGTSDAEGLLISQAHR